MSRLQRVIQQATQSFHDYDYAAAKNEVENFFWTELADNYLEMAKMRLYNEDSATHESARHTLYQLLLATLKLFAPFLPHVTEAIYQGLFAKTEGNTSIHTSNWPTVDETLIDETAEATGNTLLAIATATRRYKSDRTLSPGAELTRLQIATDSPTLTQALQAAQDDLRSITRAQHIETVAHLDPTLEHTAANDTLTLAFELPPLEG
ncbi:MAG: class I tRNA ligase family protein [Chloroflexota bacterium]|nr:class I tRNA ligase family protein [Chloroflexota bacterium]